MMAEQKTPREALSRIGMLAKEARHDIRNGDTGTAFVKLNEIALLAEAC